jgi:hypothetical protein
VRLAHAKPRPKGKAAGDLGQCGDDISESSHDGGLTSARYTRKVMGFRARGFRAWVRIAAVGEQLLRPDCDSAPLLTPALDLRTAAAT